MKSNTHPMRHSARKMTTALALVLALLLVAAAPLSAAPLLQQDSSQEQEIAAIITDPGRFEGETVTVNGIVTNTNLGDHLFILTTNDRLRLDQLLIITPGLEGTGLSPDQAVTVTGEVTTYMPDAPEFASLILEEEISDSLLGRTVLLADTVETDTGAMGAAEMEDEDEPGDIDVTDDEEEAGVDDVDLEGEDDEIETAVEVEATGESAEDEVVATEGITGTAMMTDTAGSSVVARIGDREITKQEFDDWFVSAITIIAARQGIPITEETTQLFAGMQSQFLEQMVREEVLLAEAEQRGITVSDEDVQGIIDDIRGQFDSDAAYQEGISRLGFDSEQELRNYIVVNETLRRVSQAIVDEITITPEEIQQFYDENQDLFTQNDITAPLGDVTDLIENELQRQALESRLSALEDNYEVQLMAENLGPNEDEVVTTGIPAEPVDESDVMTDTEMVEPTEGITEVTDIAPIDTITATETFTDTTGADEEESNLTEPEPMTDTTGTSADISGMSDVRTATATLRNPDGDTIGSVVFTEYNGEIVTIEVNLDENNGLAPGAHGIHIHEVGACTPDFSAAGGHFNPTNAEHGMNNPAGPHAGDLPNLELTDAGQNTMLTRTNRFTLGDGPTSLFDDDGSAIVIHAGEDDLMTDPSGNSGDRVACGIIEPGTNAAADAN